MQLSPDLRTGLKGQQANGLAAVTEREHEESSAPILAGSGIAHHGTGAVIDLALLAGGGLDDDTRFGSLGSLQLASETLDALIAAGETVCVHQVLPDGFGIATLGQRQLDGLPKRFAGAGGWAMTGWRGRCRHRLRLGVGGHLIVWAGRF